MSQAKKGYSLMAGCTYPNICASSSYRTLDEDKDDGVYDPDDLERYHTRPMPFMGRFSALNQYADKPTLPQDAG